MSGLTEREELDGLIDDGFRPAMVLLEVGEAEKEANIPSQFANKTVRALPLAHSDGRKRMFYMVGSSTIEYAEKLVEDQRTIIGYNLCVYCSVVSHATIHGRMVELDQVINDLKEKKSWDVRSSKYPNVFEVRFEIEGDDREALENHIGEVKRVGLTLSLKNRLGFVVDYASTGPRYKGQPFALTIGKFVTIAKLASPEFEESLQHIWDDKKKLQAATALQEIYSQVTDVSKITIGWAAIETMFGSDAEHILSDDELDGVCKKIEEAECFDQETRKTKLKKIKDTLRSPDFMAIKGRNARISQEIAELLNDDERSIAQNVKNIARSRGKRVHQLSEQADSIKEHIEFIERVLWACIGN